jgi:hypothetical protein
MQILHESPVLARQAVRTALNPTPDVGTTLPPALRALADCGLADQVEQLRITHERLNTEEISKLWAATQSSYRPTVAYQVTVVLIESTRPASAPLPVLEHRVFVEPTLIPWVPMLDEMASASKQPLVNLGEPVDLKGHHLDGTGHEVVLSNAHFDISTTLAPTSVEPERVQFEIPNARTADFPVGVYQVSVRLVRPGATEPVETNRLAFVLAPKVTNLPLSRARSETGTASFDLNFLPQVRQGQTISLFLANRELVPEPFAAPVGTLSFVVSNAQAGDFLARLRIDGIDSPIIDHSSTPPKFFDRRVEIT